MAKLQHHIVPVRYEQGKGFTKCEPHQARAWEARNGARILGRFPAKWQAVELCAANIKHKVGLLNYSLGRIMRKADPATGIIAISLTKEQFNNQLVEHDRRTNSRKPS